MMNFLDGIFAVSLSLSAFFNFIVLKLFITENKTIEETKFIDALVMILIVSGIAGSTFAAIHITKESLERNKVNINAEQPF